MIKKEMIAMLLAGGQGSRLGVLTEKVAKPAVAFGGKYRIIDFPLSNCINSGIDTVGVLTQYQPLRLNTHIGIGIPWDLDRNEGGVTVLPPYEKSTSSEWYTGTANLLPSKNQEFLHLSSSRCTHKQKGAAPSLYSTEGYVYRSHSHSDPSGRSVLPSGPAMRKYRYPWMQDCCLDAPASPQTQ